jgi:hypothetical protein
VSQLRSFLSQKGNSHASPFVLSSSPPPETTCHGRPTTPIKAEIGADVIDLITPPRRPLVKQEVAENNMPFMVKAVRVKSAVEGDTEVLEILDSDEEMDEARATDGELSSNIDEGTEFAMLPTDWQDQNVQSHLVCEKTRLTRQLEVERVKYLSEIPSVWPVPRVATAYVLDLRDLKSCIVEKGKVLTPDALIKNKVRTTVIPCLEKLTLSSGPRFVGGDHRFRRS